MNDLLNNLQIYLPNYLTTEQPTYQIKRLAARLPQQRSWPPNNLTNSPEACLSNYPMTCLNTEKTCLKNPKTLQPNHLTTQEVTRGPKDLPPCLTNVMTLTV